MLKLKIIFKNFRVFQCFILTWNYGFRPKNQTIGAYDNEFTDDICSLCFHLFVLLPLLHPFSSHFSRTTWVSWHQKGKPFWMLLEQKMGWQWHQLDHM